MSVYLKITDWAEMHCETDNHDDDNTPVISRMVSVYPYGNEDETLEYLVTGDVSLYRDLPAEVLEITSVVRLEFSEDGMREISRIVVEPDQWPENILAEAERMLVERI